MKAFNIDYNWQMTQDSAFAAAPGVFAKADAKKVVDWYEWIGADCFWNFAQTYNGYTWYESKFSKMNPGLTSDFFKESTELGKEKGMTVFSYMCIGSNQRYEQEHPELIRQDSRGGMSTIPSEEYLTYFTNVLVEAANHAKPDGFAIDWFRGPTVPRKSWKKAEQELFKKLMGEAFPQSSLPDKKTAQEYDKRMIEYMWEFVKSGLNQLHNIKIWANEPFCHDEEGIWADNKFLKDIDYTLNESNDLTIIPEIKNYADNIKIIQNVCGWKDHDISAMNLSDYDIDGIFGFAQADEDTCLPPVADESSGDVIKANYKNILLTREIFLK